ncbi:MAG: PDZ domain-containing protein [Deltaproteobacteria bacterium]|nr:PDZ domain-containing protein [Deltaproteobacteria bacterium]
MLLMNARKRSCQMLIGMLLWGLPIIGMAREPRYADTPIEETTDQSPGRQSLGAPQVLEIPPVQEAAPTPAEVPPVDSSASSSFPPPEAPYEPARDSVSEQSRISPPPIEANSQEATAPRTYLGVLYATAEEGAVGVKVLDVIPGSPAARAGFEGANTPPPQSNELVRTALVILAMSPVGVFAMPLVIAHDMYMASRSPGDLIVGIGAQQVRDAASFGQAMHGYRVGDTVAFSVLRNGKPLQISVQLEEEPS